MPWKIPIIVNYPPALKDVTGPRNMVHSWATTTDDATVQPRWGKIGKQKIEDAGTLYPPRMKPWMMKYWIWLLSSPIKPLLRISRFSYG